MNKHNYKIIRSIANPLYWVIVSEVIGVVGIYASKPQAEEELKEIIRKGL